MCPWWQTQQHSIRQTWTQITAATKIHLKNKTNKKLLLAKTSQHTKLSKVRQMQIWIFRRDRQTDTDSKTDRWRQSEKHIQKETETTHAYTHAHTHTHLYFIGRVCHQPSDDGGQVCCVFNHVATCKHTLYKQPLSATSNTEPSPTPILQILNHHPHQSPQYFKRWTTTHTLSSQSDAQTKKLSKGMTVLGQMGTGIWAINPPFHLHPYLPFTPLPSIYPVFFSP